MPHSTFDNIFTSIDDFLSATGRESQLFSLDVGSKTIGIAISDFRQLVSTPFHTVKRKKFTQDCTNLIQIIEDNNIKGLVIGLPLLMDGGEGKKCQSVRQFGRNLLKEYQIPILFWDERFSTVSADEVLIQSNVTLSKRKEIVDKVAASYILQSMLDTANQSHS
jgi:putative Holliday junction resolvase